MSFLCCLFHLIKTKARKCFELRKIERKYYLVNQVHVRRIISLDIHSLGWPELC